MKDKAVQVRFGIICEGMDFPSWQARAIRKLSDHPQVQPSLVIMSHPENGLQKTSRWLTLLKTPLNKLLWAFYHSFITQNRAKAYQAENLSSLLSETPRINCQILQKEYGGRYFAADDVQAISVYELDCILYFGAGSLGGEILNAARFGVWAFHHDDERKIQGAPPCFWEIYKADPITGSILYRLTQDQHTYIVLKKGFFKTKLMYAKNLDQALYESAQWPVQVCIDILNLQLDQLEAAPSQSDAPIYKLPTNIQVLAYFLQVLWLMIKKMLKSIFYIDFWNIGIVKAPIQAFLDPSTLPPVHWFPNLPKNKFIADPFGIKRGDELHIIYEDFLYKEGIGTIGSLTYKQDKFSMSSIEIREPFHLSYPFTFEYENNIYTIPESYQAKQVRLYRALNFPHEWVIDSILIDEYAGIDNTLFSHDGYWWMFSTDKQDGVHHNLKIFYAEELFGEWHPHPKNPVKTDIRSARPAGSMFHHQGSIFRPSMDYSEKIEGRITINKIKKLSTTDFSEEAYCLVNPFPETFFSDKVHTLCEAGDYTIVDGAKELLIFNNLHAFSYKLHKLWGRITRRMNSI